MTVQKPIPKIVYKYKGVGPNGQLRKYDREIFEKCELYYAPPNFLNDPFDCVLPEGRKPTREEMIEFLNLSSPGGGWEALSDAKLRKNMNPPEVNRSLNEMFAGAYGVFCVTADVENVLMWSHYGESHKGFAIGLDSSIFERFGPVVYIKGTSRLPVAANLSAFEKNLYYKANFWKYEKEFRSVRENNGTDESFRRHGIYEDNFREVVFGLKASEKTKKELRDIVARERYNRVKFRQIVIGKRGFTLKVEDIEEPP